MIVLCRLALSVLLSAAFSFMLGQTLSKSTTVCEIMKDPQRFQGKLVSVRNRVQIAFEDFELSAVPCVDRQIDGIWLEYGKGPKRQPTIWCCGDMVPRDPMALVQNSDFRRFHHFLTANKGAKFLVTATLTGRLDAVVPAPCPNAKSCCLGNGYGHLGMFCARLVIQSVSEVTGRPVDGSAHR